MTFERPAYRPDIDGLRAVAVLSVVLFHAFPSQLPGGFIGVDVFFVISGYLITTIIIDSLRQGQFSFSGFYARRIRRIFPALLLVLAATYLLGWPILLSDEYRQLGKHLAASAGFVANIIFWREAGYFDPAAETKPLLHLWSLGVEEQFYMACPLLLWLAWRLGCNLLLLIVLAALASFLFNLAAVGTDGAATFYLPQARFWELLSGSMLYWVRKGWLMERLSAGKALPNLLSLAGLALLMTGVLVIDKTSRFPGVWALMPVLAAILIIMSGPQPWLNRRILSCRAAVQIGLISYPLYLWHWPLLSLLQLREGGTPAPEMRLAALSLAVVLAWLTWRFVELPIRSIGRGRRKVILLMSLMALAGGLGYVAYRHDVGLSLRSDKEAFIERYENHFPTWRYFKRVNWIAAVRAECAFFNTDKNLAEGGATDNKPIAALDPSCYSRDSRFAKSVLVWGDSHAQVLAPGLARYMPRHWQLLQVASPGCKPDIGIDKPSAVSQCDQTNYFALKTIAEARPDVVVLAQINGHSAAKMTLIADRLERMGVGRVLFLGPVPQWRGDLPRIFVRQLWSTKPARTHAGLRRDILDSNEKLLREFRSTPAAAYVDVIGLFCDAAGCLTHVDDDIWSSMITHDYGHLTPVASEYLASKLLVGRIVAP